jgi:hypothetical protein
MEGTGMEPISTALTGIALFQKSVEFIKSNISTANDIRDIAGAIDGMFAGEKQIQQQRFGNKSIIGQTKDAASSVIDAKLAKEALEEMHHLIDRRFGYGTWQEIINERAKRIQEEKQAIAEARREKLRKQKQMMQHIQIGSIVFGVGAVALFVSIFALKYFLG